MPDGITDEEEVMLAAMGDNSKFQGWQPPYKMIDEDGGLDSNWLYFELNLRSYLEWKKKQKKKTKPFNDKETKLGVYDNASNILNRLDQIDNKTRLADDQKDLQTALDTLYDAYENTSNEEEKDRIYKAIEKIIKGTDSYKDIQLLDKVKDRDDFVHRLKLSRNYIKKEKLSKFEISMHQFRIETQIRYNKIATLIFEERKLLDAIPQMHNRAKKQGNGTSLKYVEYKTNNNYQSIAQIQGCLERPIVDKQHECNWQGVYDEFEKVIKNLGLTDDKKQFNLHVWQGLILNSNISHTLLRVFISNYLDYLNYLEFIGNKEESDVTGLEYAANDSIMALSSNANKLDNIFKRYQNIEGFGDATKDINNVTFTVDENEGTVSLSEKNIGKDIKNNLNDSKKSRFFILALFEKALVSVRTPIQYLAKKDVLKLNDEENNKNTVIKHLKSIRNCLTVVLDNIQQTYKVPPSSQTTTDNKSSKSSIRSAATVLTMSYTSCYNSNFKIIQQNMQAYLFQLGSCTEAESTGLTLQPMSQKDFYTFIFLILEILNLINIILNLIDTTVRQNDTTQAARDKQNIFDDDTFAANPKLGVGEHKQIAKALVGFIQTDDYKNSTDKSKALEAKFNDLMIKKGKDFNSKDQEEITKLMNAQLGQSQFDSLLPSSTSKKYNDWNNLVKKLNSGLALNDPQKAQMASLIKSREAQARSLRIRCR